MNSSLWCVDRLAIGCLVGTGALLLPGVLRSTACQLCLLGNLGAVAAILGLLWADPEAGVWKALREIYPILLILLLYVEVDIIVRLLYETSTYNALVRSWDARLFGGHPHVSLSQWLDGRLWREVFHGLYVSYYVLLAAGFLGVWWTAPSRFPRFAFVVLGMFASFTALFLVFPVAGPLNDPGTTLMADGWFPKLVAWMYHPFQTNGIVAGAFPSSHVGMSVGVACLLTPRRWDTRLLLWGLVVGITVSTVYGRFHYAIDAVAGLVAGVGLYWGWAWLYARLQGQRRKE